MIDYDNLYSNESIQGYDVSEYRKHMRYYKVNEAFEEEYWGPEYLEPWVSYTTGDSLVHYNKKPIGEYLTIEALTNGGIVWKSSDGNISKTIEYSKNGRDWTEITSSVGGVWISVNAGDILFFRGSNQQYAEVIDPDAEDVYSSSNVRTASFRPTCDYKVYGNIMSLIRRTPEEFANLKNLAGDCNFFGMFSGDGKLKSIDGLELPATGITNACYGYMFVNGGFQSAVEILPAKEIKESCYRAMFNECHALKTLPELPYTNVADSCFRRMFYGCSSLTGVPADYLNVTALQGTYACYSSMFYNCSSLASAPRLNSTTLGRSSYYGMFYNTALRTAPELPATKLTEMCYQAMFGECKYLTSTPVLQIDEMADQCCENMFKGCTSLTAAPITLNETRTFSGCCRSMFAGCETLTGVPFDLPGNHLVNACYDGMFSACTNLITAPKIMAESGDYGWPMKNMFDGCSNLDSVTCLCIDYHNYQFTENWLRGAKEPGTFYKNPNATEASITSRIPSTWTIVDYVPGN